MTRVHADFVLEFFIRDDPSNPRHPRSKFFRIKAQTGRLGYVSTSINSN